MALKLTGKYFEAPSTQMWQLRELFREGKRFADFDHPKVNHMRSLAGERHSITFSFKKDEEVLVSGELSIPVALDKLEECEDDFIRGVIERIQRNMKDPKAGFVWDYLSMTCRDSGHQIDKTYEDFQKSDMNLLQKMPDRSYGEDVLHCFGSGVSSLTSVKDEDFTVDEDGKAPKKLEEAINIFFLSYIFHSTIMRLTHAPVQDSEAKMDQARSWFSLLAPR